MFILNLNLQDASASKHDKIVAYNWMLKPICSIRPLEMCPNGFQLSYCWFTHSKVNQSTSTVFGFLLNVNLLVENNSMQNQVIYLQDWHSLNCILWWKVQSHTHTHTHTGTHTRTQNTGSQKGVKDTLKYLYTYKHTHTHLQCHTLQKPKINICT